MKTHFITFLLLVGTSLGISSRLYAQSSYQSGEENLKAREEFQDNKFGIFPHWGLYAMFATGEWAMTDNNLNCKECAKLVGGFYPSKFDADKWVAAIKASGAKYICLTSRHHDGFFTFDTQYSDSNVVKATPFKQDITKELAAACSRQGIKLHFYYSYLNWTREDYPWGYAGRGTERSNPQEDWKSYYQFANNQSTELPTNYDPVGAIWFDRWWDQDGNPGFNWELPEQYAMVYKLQSGCLVEDNHHQTPFVGEDTQILEHDLSGENTAGLSGQSVSHPLLETCETMNGMWGYKITDQNHKSTKTLIHYLVEAVGKNANLLTNTGPQPDGEFSEIAVQRLKEMGKWMDQYGETTYGTRGGAVAPHDWGVMTQKENKLYVHILNLQDKALFLPLADKKVKKTVLFKNGTPVRFTKNKEGVLLESTEIPEDIDHIAEFTID